MHGPLREVDLLPPGSVGRLGTRVLLLGEVDSTNAFLLRAAHTHPDGTIVTAEHQHAGRGRFGRRWSAPRGSSLLLSVLLHATDRQLEAHATLVAAVALCEAVEEGTECRPGVRWPNDVVIGGRKLGGVLAESVPRVPAGRSIVLGMGLNCLQQRGHFEAELLPDATSLEIESAGTIERARIAAALIRRLEAWLALCSHAADGPAQLRAAWRQRCVDLGARVTLLHDAESFSGTVLDISEDGDLDVQLDLGGRRRFGAATTTRSR